MRNVRKLIYCINGYVQYNVLSFQAAEEVNAAIFVHPWDMQMDGRMKPFWLPWLVGMPAETAQAICCMVMGGVLERFPKLKVGHFLV